MPENQSQQLIENSGSLNLFLENIYGVLFTPQSTFTRLRSQPSVIAGAVIVSLVNILEGIRIEQSVTLIFTSVISGLIGWVLLAFLLKTLAEIFQHNVKVEVLLTLTAFASMPWIFIAPALSLGNEAGNFVALAVLVWFTIWQIWAAAVAIAITPGQLVKIVPMALIGGSVFLIWLFNTVKLLSTL